MKNIKGFTLKELIFLAICADIGVIIKHFISPLANVITDYIHIPGGISTAFSMSFVVIGAIIVNKFGCGIIMSMVQCFISFATGHVGSMGALMPVAYFLPGLTIDILFVILKRLKVEKKYSAFFLNIASTASTAVFANILVFNLRGYAMCLYFCVAAFSGAIAGILVTEVVARIDKIPNFNFNEGRKDEKQN